MSPIIFEIHSYIIEIRQHHSFIDIFVYLKYNGNKRGRQRRVSRGNGCWSSEADGYAMLKAKQKEAR